MAKQDLVEIRHHRSRDSAWDFFHCDPAVLAAITQEELDADVMDAGFTMFASGFKRFEGGGISYLAGINESNITIHNSPENHHSFELTIYTCDVTGTGSTLSAEEKKKRLYEKWRERFKPQVVVELPTRERGNLEEHIAAGRAPAAKMPHAA